MALPLKRYVAPAVALKPLPRAFNTLPNTNIWLQKNDKKVEKMLLFVGLKLFPTCPQG